MAVGSFALPSLANCGDGLFICFAEWANSITFGAFWTFALLSFCVILFIATARLGSTRAYGYASFVGMIGGLWLTMLRLMNWSVASAFIIAGVIGIAMMIMSER